MAKELLSMDYPNLFRWRDPQWPREVPSLVVQFVEQPEKNPEYTAANGYDTFDTVLVAKVGGISAKSTAACEIERRLPNGKVKTHEINSRKYADVVKLYKEGKTGGDTGTPLSELGLDPGQIATLRARGVHGIEMLAELSDSGGEDLMGFRALREKANKFIAVREKEAPTKRLEHEISKKDQEIASLQRQLDELRYAVEHHQPEIVTEKRGPGRPRKIVEEEAA